MFNWSTYKTSVNPPGRITFSGSCVPMVVQQQRSQHGRLRASVWPAEWQFSDRLSRYLCDYGGSTFTPILRLVIAAG